MIGVNRKHYYAIARHVIQCCMLAIFCIPLILAGGMLFGWTTSIDKLSTTASMLPFYGSFSSSTLGSLTLMDPYAVLEIAAASKDFIFGWLIASLPILLFYGIVRGRAFCSWVCPVGFLLEGVDWLRNRCGIRSGSAAVPRHAKAVLAVAVLLICAGTGQPVFEAISPLSAINKGILFGSFAGLITLLVIAAVEFFGFRRIWCRALCPLGGMYEILGTLGIVSVKMNTSACTGCDACRQACLCDPRILDGVLNCGADRIEAGDCMVCGACVDACPTKALSIGIAAPFPKSSRRAVRVSNAKCDKQSPF